jgi:hypothetical protein
MCRVPEGCRRQSCMLQFTSQSGMPSHHEDIPRVINLQNRKIVERKSKCMQLFLFERCIQTSHLTLVRWQELKNRIAPLCCECLYMKKCVKGTVKEHGFVWCEACMPCKDRKYAKCKGIYTKRTLSSICICGLTQQDHASEFFFVTLPFPYTYEDLFTCPSHVCAIRYQSARHHGEEFSVLCTIWTMHPLHPYVNCPKVCVYLT